MWPSPGPAAALFEFPRSRCCNLVSPLQPAFRFIEEIPEGLMKWLTPPKSTPVCAGLRALLQPADGSRWIWHASPPMKSRDLGGSADRPNVRHARFGDGVICVAAEGSNDAGPGAICRRGQQMADAGGGEAHPGVVGAGMCARAGFHVWRRSPYWSGLAQFLVQGHELCASLCFGSR